MEEFKVLLIEDDEAARQQLAKVIRKEGYQVLVAEDGLTGLELLKKESPEIVITDLKMPGIDGLEVMHTARRISPNAQIIVMTAFGETDAAVSALREGALDYLKKPLDLDQLTLALGRAVERIVEYKKGAVFPTLLLAEDEDKTRERLARVLEKEDWKVFPAANGQEAIDVFKETKIDIVLLDIKMPKKDGLQALHEMRGITDDFEAIILTGHGDENSAIQALRDGAMHFLRKPIDLDQMILTVEKAIDKLHTDRSLKYRTRELELATQIIGTVSLENQILVDLRRLAPRSLKDFAQKLIDAMPMGLLVLRKDATIIYMNRSVAQALERQPEKADEEFVKSLGKVGIKDLPYESLMSAVNRLSSASSGTVETISTGKYSYITLAPMRITFEEKQEDAVLIILRGERGQAS
jgi:DNA-binding NtrC family response regulator